jgi:tetratricopeptide (TPR) repeat protein
MKMMLAAAALILAPGVASAQDPAQVQKLFESGQYQQVVQSTTPDAPPAALYTAAQSHQKLGATPQALELYRQLASRPEGDPWRLVGLSAQQLLENQNDAAAATARQAVTAAAAMPEAQYQLGLALAKLHDWGGAAAAFDRAAELNPSMAYAHYYGGLMHYRANRPDRMAIHFEQFLKLAPQAPERPEVLQIMRTVRR